MLRQVAKLAPLATLPRSAILLTEKPQPEPADDTLTKKWLKGLFDPEDTKPREEKKSKSGNDDDPDGGVMMPIPPGLAGLYYFREGHRAGF